MKKLLLTILSIIAIFAMGVSQTLTVSTLNNATIKSIGLMNKAVTEESMFNANHEMFQIEVLNRIFTTHLKNDGIIAPNSSQINIQLTESSLTVNSKLMPETVKEKYLSLYLGFTRQKLDANQPIKYEIKDSFNVLLAGKD